MLFIVLILSGLFRLYNNTAVALWHDEAFSALYIRYPWGEMIHRIILDVHPPLYYFILRVWSYIFGSSLLSLRSLSILFGVLTVWAGYKFIWQAFKSKQLALLAAVLIAINPFQIQYALEARMYTLGTFLILLSSWLLTKALENRKKKTWFLYAIAVAASIYTHYYLIFSILAQGIYTLFYLIKNKEYKFSEKKDNQFVNLFFAILTVIILYIPWIPSFLEQLGRVQGGYWIPPMNRWSVPGTIWKMAFGGEGINRPTLAIASVVAVIVLIYFIRKIKDSAKWHIVLGIMIPFLAAIGLSLKNDIYQDRYFVFTSLYLSLMLAVAFSSVSRKSFRNILVLALIVGSFWAFVKNWSMFEVKEKPGMAAASGFINERASKNDRIYVGSSFIFFTFKYYNNTGVTPQLVSAGGLETIPHFSGTAILTENDLVLEKYVSEKSNFKKNDIVWLLWTTGFGGSKPNIPGNWISISNESWKDTPGFKGELYVTQYRVN